jgi:hypothetical protein
MLIMFIFRRPYFFVKKLLTIIVAFFLFSLTADAQKRSRYEWLWAFTHPIAAIKVKLISKKCYHIYRTDTTIRTELDRFTNGGKLDAFRHTFFMAAFAQKVKTKKIRKLGEAHEKASYKIFLKSGIEDGEIPDSLSTVMDLKNNETGFAIGQQFKRVSLDSLKQIVISQINLGTAAIMKRKSNGIYLTCDDQEIDLKRYSKTWYIPKCLIPSNYRYP